MSLNRINIIGTVQLGTTRGSKRIGLRPIGLAGKRRDTFYAIHCVIGPYEFVCKRSVQSVYQGQ